MTDQLTGRIAIAAAPDALWALLTTASEIPTWYDDWDAIDVDDAALPLRVGSRFHLRRDRDAHRAWCQITVAEAPVCLRWTQRGDGGAAMIIDFRLIPDGDGGTVLTHTKTDLVAGVERAHSIDRNAVRPRGPRPRSVI